MKSRISKPLLSVDSVPIIAYSLKVLERHPLIAEIVVVANRLNRKAIERIVAGYGIRKVRAVVLGGARRRDSVRLGLEASSPQSELVLVHDAARPFITAEDISAVIRKAARTGAAIVAVPVRPTIKRVGPGGLVKETVERRQLWEAQTPQAFRRALIIKAHQLKTKAQATDDAYLVERLGVAVVAVKGSSHNIKVTTAEDLVLAEAIARFRRKEG